MNKRKLKRKIRLKKKLEMDLNEEK